MFVCYADTYTVPLPEGHKFPMQKYRMLREYLVAENIVLASELHLAPQVQYDDIALVHAPEYIHAFCTGTLDAKMQRRIGLPWSNNFVLRTLASTGGTVRAAQVALDVGFAGNLAGGTHHAFAAAGEGFCVFNDIAVAIAVLQRSGAIQRAAIIDLDVHQGNGTADIFTGNDSVFTLSLHGAHNYPFTKVPSTYDVALPDHCDDDEYLNALRNALPRVREFQPDILFYQGGVDILREDVFGRLDITLEGVSERDNQIAAFARELGVPFVATLGGGYAQPIEITVQAHANTYRVFRRFF